MKRFYFLRIVCIAASFALLFTSATASWPITSRLLAAAILAFGLICELYIRYKTGEEQEVRATCRELISAGTIYFTIYSIGYAALMWLFEKINLFSSLYATSRLLYMTMLWLYLMYLFKIYFESRKNQTQEKP